MENQNTSQIEHPDAGGAQIMGILSIVFGCGPIGWILMFIARGKVKKVFADAAANPGKYSEASLKKAKTGKTCATIGMILMIVGIVFWILYFTVIGAAIANS